MPACQTHLSYSMESRCVGYRLLALSYIHLKRAYTHHWLIFCYSVLYNIFSSTLAAVFAGIGITMNCSKKDILSMISSGALSKNVPASAARIQSLFRYAYVHVMPSDMSANNLCALLWLVCCYLTKSPWIRHNTFIGSEEIDHARFVSRDGLKVDYCRDSRAWWRTSGDCLIFDGNQAVLKRVDAESFVR